MTELLVSLAPDDLGPWSVVALLSVSFIGSFVTVAFGIGGGILVLAVLASVMPPAALIPVHGVVQSGSNLARLATLLNHVKWSALPGFVLGTLIGVSLGGLVAVDLPPFAVQISVGLFVIWSVVRTPPAWLRRWSVVTGIISSFLTMFFGATGPFVAGFIKSLALERHAHVATHAAFMSLQHVLKISVFAVLGFAFAPWIWIIVAMIATGFIGTLAGRAVLNRISDHDFRRILDVILILIALRLIWAGTRAAFAV